MGERAPMTDLMAWNADATRMPYRMHSEYLRHLFLDNDLAEGRYHVGGSPVRADRHPRADLRRWAPSATTSRRGARSTRSICSADTDVTFVLTSGGHNAGIVSEPGHDGRYYRVSTQPTDATYTEPDVWLGNRRQREGSWWPEWVRWLDAHSGSAVKPPRLGVQQGAYAARADAPGNYVLMA